MSTPSPVVAVPRTVSIAYWLYIACAALSIVSLIVTLMFEDVLRSGLEHPASSATKAISPSAASSIVSGYVVNGVIFAVVWVVLFALFATFLRRGARWARAVLTIVTVLSFLNFFAGFGVGLAQILCAVVATVLVWLRVSSEYFRRARPRPLRT